MNKVRVTVLGLIGVVVLGMLAFLGVRAMIRSHQAAPFKPHLAEYAALAASPSEGEPGYVKGKVVIINLDGPEVDDTYFDLPAALLATKPEEVGTVCLVKWGKDVVGQYGTASERAYQRYVLVTVVDKERKTIVGQPRQRFEGGPPPATKKRSESGEGSKPTGDVVHLLTVLPHKP